MGPARRMGAAAACAFLLPLTLCGSPSLAQVVKADGPTPVVFANEWGTFGAEKAAGGKTLIAPTENTFQLGDWLINGTINAGTLYNDNIFATDTNPVASWGFGIAPSIVAERSTGPMKTSLYGALDADFYDNSNKADTVTGRGGVVNLWEIQRDLIFRAQLDYYRGIYYPGGTSNALTGDVVYSNPEGYNQYFASAGVHKEFGQAFIDLGGSLKYTDYTNPDAVTGIAYTINSPDGAIYTLSGRVGYNISPLLYAFVEPQLNWWRYKDGIFDANGLRVIGGIGTDRIGLFRGEVYGGYQVQNFGSASFGDVDMPVLGAILSWYPTRFLTLNFALDQSVTISSPSLVFSAGNVGIYNSYVTKNTTASVTGTYEITRQLSSTAGLTYLHSDYVDLPRTDNQWAVTAGMTYMMVTNWGINLNYSYINLDSNIPVNSYVQNIIRISARGQI